MLKAIVAAGALSVLMIGGAAAADLVLAPPMVDDVAVTDWDGVYAGLTGAAWFQGGVIFPAVGVELGANFVSGDMLFGVEGDLAYYWTSGNFDAGLTGRVGVVLNDTAVLYGSVGVGALSDGVSFYVPVGVGAEFMLTESVSLDLSGEYLIGNGFNATRIGAALNWHF